MITKKTLVYKKRLIKGALRGRYFTTELATIDAKLQAFYHYIKEGTVESELSQTICDKITTLKIDSITRSYYLMTTLKIADLQQATREEGREEELIKTNWRRRKSFFLTETLLR